VYPVEALIGASAEGDIEVKPDATNAWVFRHPDTAVAVRPSLMSIFDD